MKVRFPPDEEFDEWSCEEKEQFRCYRQDISDTIVYAYNVLGENFRDAIDPKMRKAAH